MLSLQASCVSSAGAWGAVAAAACVAGGANRALGLSVVVAARGLGV